MTTGQMIHRQILGIDSGSIAGHFSHTQQFYLLCKRILDIVVSVLALLFLSPLLVFIALLILLDSPGSPIFSQGRVGCRKRCNGGTGSCEAALFTVYKFRTMYHDSDQSLHKDFINAFAEGDVQATENRTAAFKLGNDPRITRVGRFLRKTSLDELPQLINVVNGDMSLVGPRPVPEYEVEHYTEEQRGRLCTVPGVTGLSITHKLGLSLNKFPSSREILQPLPAAPEGSYSRFAVRLATEETTKLGDPADRLVDGRHCVGQCGRLVNTHVERFPLDGRQHRSAG